jgi:16S rRNA (cytosine967-C5)-methyltransferase
MISPARKLSYRILCRIELLNVFSDDALNCEEMGQLDPRDRHLTMEIVYGVLRWQALLDYFLAKASTRPWQEAEAEAKVLLRMSLYQMWYMDRIPDHAIVNDAVELAKRALGKGIDRYINGILRKLTRTRPWKKSDAFRDVPRWIQVSLPQWLWDRWEKRYGESAAEAFAISLNVPPRHAWRIHGKLDKSRQPPFEMIPSDIVPDAFIRNATERINESNSDNSTFIHYQDEASQLIPYLLGEAASGWRIWDVCAAPGGKSTILSKLCGESGHVVASDMRKERVKHMIEFLAKGGLLKTDVVVADACQSAPFRLPFDAVLADVPCSGLGTLRRNPEIKWQFRIDRFVPLQTTQKQILHNASEAVRVGGHLLYSTCSTEPEENEQVISSFLSEHPRFGIQPPTYPSGIQKWICPDQMVRTFPSTRLWDGFFAALLVRND